MWQAFMCVGAPAIICGVLMTFALCAVARAPEPYDANGYQAKPKVINVFCMDGCKPCRALKAHLEHRKLPITVKTVREQPLIPERGSDGKLLGYPAVCYDNNGRSHWDNGQLIYKGQCERPESVLIVHWQP